MKCEDLTLTDPERQFLRAVARQAIEAVACGRPAPDPRQMAREMEVDPEPRLTALRGAFVTLTSAGQLRGCIGYIEGIKPLMEAVAENGRSAAANDPRFPPVEEKELDVIDIEISALTPLDSVDGPSDIVLGRHGVVLAKAGCRAVFLPQVAVEQGWDCETTLTHLSLKAGLGADGWREGAEFLVFEADVF